MIEPALAVGDPSPVWPIAGVKPKFAIDSFMRPRGDGARYHAGIDMNSGVARGTLVVATEPGRVVALQGFNGPTAVALLLETDTGLVLNYGEIEPDSWLEFNVAKGSRVAKGQPLARIGRNPEGGTMLHFETYTAGTRKTWKWYTGEPPPAALLNPTAYVSLAAGQPLPNNYPAPKPAPTPPAPQPQPSSPSSGSSAAGWGLGLGLAALFLWKRYGARR